MATYKAVNIRSRKWPVKSALPGTYLCFFHSVDDIHADEEHSRAMHYKLLKVSLEKRLSTSDAFICLLFSVVFSGRETSQTLEVGAGQNVELPKNIPGELVCYQVLH